MELDCRVFRRISWSNMTSTPEDKTSKDLDQWSVIRPIDSKTHILTQMKERE